MWWCGEGREVVVCDVQGVLGTFFFSRNLSLKSLKMACRSD